MPQDPAPAPSGLGPPHWTRLFLRICLGWTTIFAVAITLIGITFAVESEATKRPAMPAAQYPEVATDGTDFTASQGQLFGAWKRSDVHLKTFTPCVAVDSSGVKLPEVEAVVSSIRINDQTYYDIATWRAPADGTYTVTCEIEARVGNAFTFEEIRDRPIRKFATMAGFVGLVSALVFVPVPMILLAVMITALILEDRPRPTKLRRAFYHRVASAVVLGSLGLLHLLVVILVPLGIQLLGSEQDRATMKNTEIFLPMAVIAVVSLALAGLSAFSAVRFARRHRPSPEPVAESATTPPASPASPSPASPSPASPSAPPASPNSPSSAGSPIDA